MGTRLSDLALGVSILEFNWIYEIVKIKNKTVNLIKRRINMSPVGLNTAVDL